MSALIPKRPRGRQSPAAEARYQEEVRAFRATVLKIKSTLDFAIGPREYCYLLEPHGLNKGDFDAAQKLRRPAASVYLKEELGVDRAPATLADPRKDNPSFRHIDKVPYYAISDLDDWVRRKLSAVKQAVAKETSPAAISSLAKQVTTAGAAKQDDQAAP